MAMYIKLLLLGVLGSVDLFLGNAVQAASLAGISNNVSVLLGDNTYFDCILTDRRNEDDMLQFTQMAPGPGFLIGLNQEVLPEGDKYSVSQPDENIFRYHINTVDVGDAGGYRCTLGHGDAQAFMTVCVPPEKVEVYWPDNKTSVDLDTPTTLTCLSSRSKPGVIFRWFIGAAEITDQATILQPVLHDDGFVDSSSALPLTPTERDDFAPFTCVVEFPGVGPVSQAQTRLLAEAAHGAAAHQVTGLTEGKLLMLALVSALVCITRL